MVLALRRAADDVRARGESMFSLKCGKCLKPGANEIYSSKS